MTSRISQDESCMWVDEGQINQMRNEKTIVDISYMNRVSKKGNKFVCFRIFRMSESGDKELLVSKTAIEFKDDKGLMKYCIFKNDQEIKKPKDDDIVNILSKLM